MAFCVWVFRLGGMLTNGRMCNLFHSTMIFVDIPSAAKIQGFVNAATVFHITSFQIFLASVFIYISPPLHFTQLTFNKL